MWPYIRYKNASIFSMTEKQDGTLSVPSCFFTPLQRHSSGSVSSIAGKGKIGKQALVALSKLIGYQRM